jgi:hypothetical protein
MSADILRTVLLNPAYVYEDCPSDVSPVGYEMLHMLILYPV